MAMLPCPCAPAANARMARRVAAVALLSMLAGCGRSGDVAVPGAKAVPGNGESPNPPGGGLLQGPGTFVVDTTDDAIDALPGNGKCATAAGTCSLRAAVQESNALLILSTNLVTRTNLIIVPPGHYVLTLAPPLPSVVGESLSLSGQLSLLGSTNIRGAGADRTIVDGNATDRIFAVIPTVTASISDMTITNGASGAIWNEGQLTLNRVVLSKSKGLYGGGIFNTPTSSMVMENSSVVDNEARDEGGGIRCDAACLIVNSTISGNRVTYEGTTFDGSPFGEGGGLDARAGGPVTIVNSTIVNNHAATGGGGVNTAASYQGGGGVLDDSNVIGRPLELINSIVAHNTSGSGPANCKSTLSQVRSFGGNISDDDSCGLNFTNDKPNTDPLLGEMTVRNGVPAGHAPMAGSPAIGNGVAGNCPPLDQGSAPRGERCDSGAMQGR